MKKIALSRGLFATVDDDSLEELSAWKWCAAQRGRKFYAIRNLGGGRMEYMHRRLVDCPRGLQVDHINGDGLDNRRENLRVVTTAANAWNSSRHWAGTWQMPHGQWCSLIRVNGTRHYVGLFDTKEEAVNAYAEAATRLRGKNWRPGQVPALHGTGDL